MRAVAAGVTDVGLQRDHNEDSFAILEDHTLYIVADGMGGHRAGDVASKLATEAIVDFFRATATEDFTWPFHFDARLSEEENRLLTGIRIANRQIVDRSARSREFHGMGTTVVGCLFSS
ncbi:MAG TPA: protein phosphatase 2C domain-containing protein, partial [Polyangiaceae bacterium]